MAQIIPSWLCFACLASIFPFNHLSNDDFDLTINELAHGNLNLAYDRLTMLQLNPLCGGDMPESFQDRDPDANFYNSIDCNYYLTGEFNVLFSNDLQPMYPCFL